MAMNNTTADAVAANICTALGITDPGAQSQWQQIMRAIYAGIVQDEVVTINANTVITVGSATTQTGPTTPVTCTVS